VAVVIPARFASSRFPGKPLALIAGEPLVAHALRTARQAARADRVVVATDDDRIAAVAAAAGAEVVLTDPDLPSGSDRVWAAAAASDHVDIIVNLQVDEPLLPGSVLDALVDALVADASADMATPVVATARADVGSDDVVTVVRDDDGTARYFSRSVIPWGADPVWRHVGVYAYRRHALRRYVSAPPSKLEQTERLEQLRALSLGLRIAVVEIELVAHAVDRPADVAAVERLLEARGPVHAQAPPP
jgi:3-deoxy-manno-octulosonate cytidylyltransferase (CMP-KDO synthetase)